MFIKSIILAAVFLRQVRWIYCEKATVPHQVCKRYLDYQVKYAFNDTMDESVFKDANFTLRLIRQQLKPDSECKDPIINLSVNRSIYRKGQVVANYRVLIEIRNARQFNYSKLNMSTGMKIDECFEEMFSILRNSTGRYLIFTLNISGVEFEPIFATDNHPSQQECRDKPIVYCPAGSENVNKSCECSRGTYLDAKLTTCTKCPKNTYQEQTGMFNCTPCERGYTTLNITGRSNRTACTPVIQPTNPTTTQQQNTSTTTTPCDKGKYLKNGSCIPCPKNTYKDTLGNASCTQCPKGQVTLQTQTMDEHLCIEEPDPGDSSTLAIALPICFLALVVVAGILFFLFWRKKKREQEERNSKIIKRKFTVVENPRYVTPENSSDEETVDNQCTTLGHLAEEVERRNLEIPRDCVTTTRVRLGRGNFGEVKQVIVRKSNETEMLYAAKMARGGNSQVSLEDMLDELEIHLKLEANHENVVNLIGVCSGDDGPFYLIMEYCDNGSLIEYLRKHEEVPEYVNIAHIEPLSLEWRLSRTLEICNGMKYLASHKIVHRDLAARNVLLDSNTAAKICDFGMAKDVYLKSYYKQQREGSFPLRWMAIDAIQTFEFTEKTDVWSFGVLIWEIFTDGKLPYYDIIDDQKVAHYILNGKKLKRPEKCPKFLYNIMLKCWSNKRYNRPKFWELYDILNENIHPAKRGRSLKRRVSRNVKNTFNQTKSSLRRKMSRKGSNKSREGRDSFETPMSSRKHSQSSFDRTINDFGLQRLQEIPNAMSNPVVYEETEVEVNSAPKKKRQDENQNEKNLENSALTDLKNANRLEKKLQSSAKEETLNETREHERRNNMEKKLQSSQSSRIPQDSTNNDEDDKITNLLARKGSKSDCKTTNDDVYFNLLDNLGSPNSMNTDRDILGKGQENCTNTNTFDPDDTKKAASDGDKNSDDFGTLSNADTLHRNGLNTPTDSTEKYTSSQETTNLHNLSDDSSETSGDTSATIAESVPETSVLDQTSPHEKMKDNSLPEKKFNPDGHVFDVKTFNDLTEKDKIRLMTESDDTSSNDLEDTPATASAKEINFSSQVGISPEKINNGFLYERNSNQVKEETEYTANDEEKYAGLDEAEGKDGLQRRSDGSDFFSDVLNAVNVFKNDDDDLAQPQNTMDDEETPNSSSC